MKVGDIVVVAPGEGTAFLGGILEPGDVCLVEGTDIGVGGDLFLTVRVLRTGLREAVERLSSRFQLLDADA